MFIEINYNKDIRRILNNNFMLVDGCEVDRIYSAPGHFYYIDIVKYGGELYLYVSSTRSRANILKWTLSIDDYINTAESFGFKKNRSDGYLSRSISFDEEIEREFIETLLNININLALRYQLK